MTPAVMTTSSKCFATRARNSSTCGRLRTRAVHHAPFSAKGASKSASKDTSKDDRTSVSSKSSTRVMRWSDGSRGSSSGGCFALRGPPRGAARGAAGVGASRCLAPRVKKPILGKENLRRGAALPFLPLPFGRGEVGLLPSGDCGMGLPKAFSSSVRGAKVAWRARIFAWDIGLGGSSGVSDDSSGAAIRPVLMGVAGVGEPMVLASSSLRNKWRLRRAVGRLLGAAQGGGAGPRDPTLRG
mmetsp:Transcript_29318/g.87697  ORF Transcript_29318/g.87697 Transcript_29318/m.87697 type:complete len:241 (+) Transcript_29318:890-1612(+)